MDNRMKALVDHFTIDHAEVKAIEEMSELIQVLCKFQVMAHGGFAKAPEIDFKSKAIEEMAHVKMRLDMLQYAYAISDEEIAQEQEKKLQYLCETFNIAVGNNNA